MKILALLFFATVVRAGVNINYPPGAGGSGSSSLSSVTTDGSLTGAGTSGSPLGLSGTVLSTLTVQGNAFSIGVTTLNVVGGKVGIGTSSPSTKLHLSSGTLLIDGNASTPFQIGTTSYFYSDGSVVLGGATVSSGTVVIKSTSSSASNPILNLEDNNGVPRFLFRNDGRGLFGASTILNQEKFNFGDPTPAIGNYCGSAGSPVACFTSVTNTIGAGGIATVGIANASLAVAGEGTSLGFFGRFAGGFGTMWGKIEAGVSTTGGYRGFLAIKTARSNSVPTEALRIDDLQNVGIGTTDPASLLNVQSSTGTTQPVLSVSSNTAAPMWWIDGAGHQVSSGAVAVLTSCGTGAVINGDDSGGHIIPGAVPGTGCVVTFAIPYKTVPSCGCNDVTTNITTRVSAESITAFTCSGVFVASDSVGYWCKGGR